MNIQCGGSVVPQKKKMMGTFSTNIFGPTVHKTMQEATRMMRWKQHNCTDVT